jgi:DNA-directed RNA polymerase subunit E'/Rpb7
MSLFVKSIKRNIHAQQQGLYNQILINRSIPISINNIGNNIKETLETAIAFQIEGKCIVEGFIKPNSIEIITFSSGLVTGSFVVFEVVFQCYVCSPVEGMNITCIAKHINKAGIRAEINETPSPLVIFIARDHNYMSPLFSQVKDNDEIKVRVIGQRFELNDKYISIIAELIETNVPAAKKSLKNKTGMKEPVISIFEPEIESALTEFVLPDEPIINKAPTIAAPTIAAPTIVAKRKLTLKKKPTITINK